MTLNEVFKRVVRAHLLLIGLCLLAPLVTVGYLEMHGPRDWVATVRTQVESKAPSSTTEADALSSRVLALATTPYLVRQALNAAKVPGDATVIANRHVTTQRLGESQVIELSVSNPSKELARKQVTAIASRVVQFMNDGNQQVFQAQLETLRAQLASAVAERDQAVQRLVRDATPNPLNQARLNDAQATVDRLNGTEAQMELSNATRDLVVLINGPDPQLHQNSSSLVPRGALALLVGLLLGVSLAMLLEMLRPRIADARSVARVLGAPMISTGRQGRAALRHTLSLAARRQGVETVVVIGVDRGDERLAQALLDELSTIDVEVRPRTGERVGGGAFTDGAAVANVLRGHIRFCPLAEVGVADELTAGLVVLSSGSPLVRDLDDVTDIVETTRWPVVGVLDPSAERRRWSR